MGCKFKISHGFCAALAVVQQAAAVRTHSDLQVGEYTDVEETSTWTYHQWSEKIIKQQVCGFRLISD